MLAFAEDVARQDGCAPMALSASELQQAAISLYRNSGYQIVHEEIRREQSNKAVGGGFDGFILKRIYDEPSGCQGIALFDDGPYSWPSGRTTSA